MSKPTRTNELVRMSASAFAVMRIEFMVFCLCATNVEEFVTLETRQATDDTWTQRLTWRGTRNTHSLKHPDTVSRHQLGSTMRGKTLFIVVTIICYSHCYSSGTILLYTSEQTHQQCRQCVYFRARVLVPITRAGVPGHLRFTSQALCDATLGRLGPRYIRNCVLRGWTSPNSVQSGVALPLTPRWRHNTSDPTNTAQLINHTTNCNFTAISAGPTLCQRCVVRRVSASFKNRQREIDKR